MRVLHLTGSPTSHFFDDLSRLYAADCLSSLGGEHEHVIAHVAPDGSWRFPASLDGKALQAAAPMTIGEAVARLEREPVDIALPQLFCRAGMTDYRALLDVLRIPFVGNRADVMAVGADKAVTKAIVASAGVPVAGADVMGRPGPITRSLPVVVKPVDADNSHGVTLVRNEADADAALATAFEHSDRVLVEDFVPLGREVRCGVIERDGELVVLPLEEYAVDANSKPIRDAADKLVRTAGDALRLVAKDAEHAWVVPPDDPINETVGRAAMRAHEALGCRHYSLFDFRIDPAGRPFLLEASLYCSFAPTSVLAVMAAATGVSVDALFTELAALTVRSARR